MAAGPGQAGPVGVAYTVELYPEATEQLRVLPAEARRALGEVLAVLELTPWNGDPYNAAKPDGWMRIWTFGAAGQGLVTYLVLEDQQRVDVLQVAWVG